MTRCNDRSMLQVAVVAFVLLASPADALDLFADPVPQATTNTCQSYAIMLALAARGDPAFPISSFAELRQAEGEFRTIAEGISGGPYGHEALSQALKEYTGGKYSLKIETRSDIVDWMARIRELTTLKSSADLFISQLTGTNFPVVLTSATKFGDSTYSTGHILAILGMSGSGLDSSTELVAFNSAIKGGGAINRCEPGTQPGDMRYTAGVTSTNDFLLKDFPGHRIMYVIEN